MTTSAPRPAASFVRGLWDQTALNLTGLIGVATMRFIGPQFMSSYYKKVYDGL